MNKSIERLREIVARLRSPSGCPWDREQTHATLKPHLLEECYELIDAIDDGDDPTVVEELGDLLLQVVMHSQMAEEEQRFDLDQVIDSITDKLIRRHPHVFGSENLPTSQAVLSRWEVIKQAEKKERSSTLDGVPRHLPALARAQKVQTKVARNGFDWPDTNGPLAKIREELAEIEASPDTVNLAEEVGDLLFACVNLARKNNLDAEQSLAAATAKFQARYRAMEAFAAERGLVLGNLPLIEQDRIWDEVKARES